VQKYCDAIEETVFVIKYSEIKLMNGLSHAEGYASSGLLNKNGKLCLHYA
jgi:hypothetical protein